jgi:hypothetical protein
MDDEDPIDASGDLPSTDRAMLVALSHHQGDRTPLSLDQECLLDSWVAGSLSSIDADRAAGLAKHNVFAAERVLEHRLISAANEGPGVPAPLARQVLRASGSPGTRTARLFGLRWPTLSVWQWSGLGALAAATVAIAVLGFQFWQQQLRPEQSFQIAMVTLEDRSVLAEGVRRTRGLQPAEEPAKSRFRDINIPTALLQRAITSASNNKGAADHSELITFLHAQHDTYNNQKRILIDSALADSLSKKVDQRESTEVRVYDLDDQRAGNIRSKIDPPPKDAHFLFLTVRP